MVPVPFSKNFGAGPSQKNFGPGPGEKKTLVPVPVKKRNFIPGPGPLCPSLIETNLNNSQF